MKKLFILLFVLSVLFGCKRDDVVQVEKNGDFNFSSTFTTTEQTERDNFNKATLGVFSQLEGIETKLEEASTLISQINKDTKKEEEVLSYTLSFQMSGNLDKIPKDISKKTGYLQKISDDVFIIYPEGDKVASLTTSGSARIETITNGKVEAAKGKVDSIGSPYVIFLKGNGDTFEQYVDVQTKTVKYDKNGKLIETGASNMMIFIFIGLGLLLALGGFLFKRSRA